MKEMTERDGKWIDDMGACKVCGGEIPEGHKNSCDIYKMEQKIKLAEACLKQIMDADYRGNRSSESVAAERTLTLIESIK